MNRRRRKRKKKKKDQRQDEGGNIASNSSLNEDSPEGEQLQRKNGKLRTTRFQTWKIRLRKRSGGKGCWKIGWGQFKSSVCACVRVQMTITINFDTFSIRCIENGTISSEKGRGCRNL